MNHTLTRRRTLARRGFTLVEVIVIVTVLALLMTVVAGRVMGVFGRGQAEIAKTQADPELEANELVTLRQVSGKAAIGGNTRHPPNIMIL